MRTTLALLAFCFALAASGAVQVLPNRRKAFQPVVAASGGETYAVTAYGSGSDLHGYLWMGFAFTNGPTQITVTKLGRVRSAANAEVHEVGIWNFDPNTLATNASGNQLISKVSVDMSVGAVGTTNFAACSIVLAANGIYIVAATESGSDVNAISSITTTADIMPQDDRFINGTDWSKLNGRGYTTSRVQFSYTKP